VKNQPLIVGVAAAVTTIVIGIGGVLVVTSGDDNAGGTAGPDASSTRPSSSSSRSSTTTTSKPAGAATTAPTAAPNTPTTTTAEPPDPPDPPDPADRYNPVPLPPGISGTITNCGWSPANGGQLEASGTATNVGAEEEAWFVNVYWLVNNQGQNEELDFQFEFYDLAIGQTVSWNLSTGSPESPPNLSCALEVD
jgi:hypothetical protein